jgi:hypothetical protein
MNILQVCWWVYGAATYITPLVTGLPTVVVMVLRPWVGVVRRGIRLVRRGKQFKSW